MVHSDVRPELIEYPTAEREHFRLMDRLADPALPSQVQLNNLRRGKDLYMSPTLFFCLANRVEKVRNNPYKSDVFSLGMVLLEAGLLESVQPIYNFDKRDIEEEVIVELVERFIDKYPGDALLQELLMIMLEFNEQLRMSPRRLLSTIRKMRETREESEPQEIEVSLMNQLNFTASGYRLKDDFEIQRSEEPEKQRSLLLEISEKKREPMDDGEAMDELEEVESEEAAEADLQVEEIPIMEGPRLEPESVQAITAPQSRGPELVRPEQGGETGQSPEDSGEIVEIDLPKERPVEVVQEINREEDQVEEIRLEDEAVVEIEIELEEGDTAGDKAEQEEGEDEPEEQLEVEEVEMEHVSDSKGEAAAEEERKQSVVEREEEGAEGQQVEDMEAEEEAEQVKEVEVKEEVKKVEDMEQEVADEKAEEGREERGESESPEPITGKEQTDTPTEVKTEGEKDDQEKIGNEEVKEEKKEDKMEHLPENTEEETQEFQMSFQNKQANGGMVNVSSQNEPERQEPETSKIHTFSKVDEGLETEAFNNSFRVDRERVTSVRVEHARASPSTPNQNLKHQVNYRIVTPGPRPASFKSRFVDLPPLNLDAPGRVQPNQFTASRMQTHNRARPIISKSSVVDREEVRLSPRPPKSHTDIGREETAKGSTSVWKTSAVNNVHTPSKHTVVKGDSMDLRGITSTEERDKVYSRRFKHLRRVHDSSGNKRFEYVTKSREKVKVTWKRQEGPRMFIKKSPQNSHKDLK